MLRRPRGLGAVAPARLPARPGHRRHQGGQPAGDRRASSAATASPPGARPRRSAKRNSLHIIRTAEAFLTERGRAEPFGPVLPRYDAAAGGRAPGAGRRAGPGDPRPRLPGPAAGRPLHRLRGRAGLPGARPSTPGSRRWAPPARTTSCAPRSARWSWTCPPTPRSTGPSPGCGNCTPRTGRSTRPTTTGTPPPDSPAMRGADPAIVLVPGVGHVLLRQGQADRAGRRRVLRQRRQRDARRRGGLLLRTHRGVARSSASSTGSWRRPSCGGCPRRSRWRPGSRWSPAPARGSAGPSRTGWPPRARAWWSRT